MSIIRNIIQPWTRRILSSYDMVSKPALLNNKLMSTTNMMYGEKNAHTDFLATSLPQLMNPVSDRGSPVSLWIPEASVHRVINYYRGLDDGSSRLAFLSTVAAELGVRHDRVMEEVAIFQKQKGREEASLLQAESHLRHSLVPPYSVLFSHISRLQGGVKFLVDLRADLLLHLSSSASHAKEAELKTLNETLRELLIGWFAAGMLSLQQVTWDSSCDMLEKISNYEAVHPIRHWSDIKHRVGPYRRCFVFTHSSMPSEPLVILHTALCREIPASIQSIVRKQDERHEGIELGEEDPEEAQAAIFYSITSTQKGLQGVELGNHLIKSVVRQLQSEFPTMHQFCTLSPIPGFRDWLVSQINKEVKGDHGTNRLLSPAELDSLQSTLDLSSTAALSALKNVLVSKEWYQSESLVESLCAPLMRLCARYLYLEKRRSYALNPVANFHLRNGATLWRLNWLGDVSPRGLGASCGMMVNYRYYLDNTTAQSQNYIQTHEIAASQQIHDLLTENTLSSKL